MLGSIIFVPFAYISDAQSGVNITTSGKQRIDLYLQNAAVALCSARYYNPNVTVALVTNMPLSNISPSLLSLFDKRQIKVLQVPFDRFVFAKEYQWALAFYKLCALSYIVEQGFSKVAYLDTDVYIQGSFSPIWKECEESILLYDINHGLNTPDYQQILDEIKSFTHCVHFPTHFGGEFFAASLPLAQQFINQARTIYEKMKQQNFVTAKGDEFIISVCASYLKPVIKNAGAYIFRFWTGFFYLVSTSYKYNAVIILHVPSEKERGMLTLFHNYISHNKVPSLQRVHKILHLSRMPLSNKILTVFNWISARLGVKKFDYLVKHKLKLLLLKRRFK